MTTYEMNQLSDTALARLFAEKVAGWKMLDFQLWDVGSDRNPLTYERSDGTWIFIGEPPFVEMADAVLPWLDKLHPCGWRAERFLPIDLALPKCGIRVSVCASDGKWLNVDEDTFSRAACIAIIRASGSGGEK